MLFNDESKYSLRLERGVQEGHQNDRTSICISNEKVEDALREIKSEKLVDPDLIPMEILKCFREGVIARP